MRNLIYLVIVITIFTIISCEDYLEETNVSIDVTINSPEGRVDTIYIGSPEWPPILSESKKIDELCRVRTLYQNLDEDATYNEGVDRFIYRDTTCNGDRGPQGPKGDSSQVTKPDFHFEAVALNDLCHIYLFYEEDVLLLQDTVCGKINWIVEKDTIVQTKIYFFYDTIREIISNVDTLIISKLDTVFVVNNFFDTIFSIDSVIIYKKDTVFSIDSIFTFELDTIYNIEYIYIYQKDTVYSIDSVFISSKDTLVIYDSVFVFAPGDTTFIPKETSKIEGPFKLYGCKDTIWFDDLFSESGYAITKLSFDAGNKKGGHLEIFGQDSLGNIFLLFDIYSSPIPDFNWEDPLDYLTKFNKSINQSEGIIKIGVVAKYDKFLKEKNEYLHLRKIRITGIKE